MQGLKNEQRKDHIKLMFHRIAAIDPRSRVNISKYQQKSWKNKSMALGALKVLHENMNTEPKMASLIYENYGLGSFNIFVFNRLMPNRNYNSKNFKCSGTECKYFNSCKVKRRVSEGTIRTCRKNKKLWPNWQKQARIIIKEHPNPLSHEEYVYEFPKKHFSFNQKKWAWLWKGRGESRKINREDYF